MNSSFNKTVYIVNAFTHNDMGGNKAGVVIDCDNLSSNDMAAIAKEVNLSETAFVIKSKCDDYDYEVRFFTPSTEVDLCGHATIATFYTLAKLDFINPNTSPVKLKQKTLAGILDIEIYFDNDTISYVLMTQTNPKFYSYIDDIKELCDILGITIEDAGIQGHTLKPMIISTGLKDIMFPVKSLSSLKRINPDFQDLKEYTDKLNLVGLHAFSLETENSKSSVATRNFGPSVGIDEESATGTSNGALCAYIMKHNILEFKDTLTISCEQGYYMNNPSEIICKGEAVHNDYIIKVGGVGSIEKTIEVTYK
ncbi:PhzF family phenazine biosynthesis protein [uncultured Clostridium sp.]|uniref:PhzF family phenazine biosynthesis protein n=1 Tax=uncultured Clostridium sp. TaxID=59620 RepID=UPI00321764F6